MLASSEKELQSLVMSKTAPESIELQKFLPYRLSIVTNKVSSKLASLYSDRFGISIAEWRVMAVLGQKSNLSADEVCAMTEMDKVSVSRAVTKLMKKKQLLRNFSKEDKRRSILKLSRSGYAIYMQIVPLALSFEQEIVKKLSAKEQGQLENLLNKLDLSATEISALSIE